MSATVGDLSVYVWSQVLMLSSAVPYDRDDLTNQLAHITNTARQAEGEWTRSCGRAR